MRPSGATWIRATSAAVWATREWTALELAGCATVLMRPLVLGLSSQERPVLAGARRLLAVALDGAAWAPQFTISEGVVRWCPLRTMMPHELRDTEDMLVGAVADAMGIVGCS